MKQGGRFAKKSAGFTIVETLIVLAVSGGLFMIAALYIGGKQAKTEFQVGVRDIQTQLQQIINQTESGYYGTNSTSKCTIVGGVPTITANAGNLGSSGDCIFIGKAFVVDGPKLYVYPLAGLRQTITGDDTTSPVEAKATVVGSPDTYALPNGISQVTSSYDGGTLSGGIRGFAVLTSMSNAGDSATGSQTFGLHALRGPFTSGGNFVVTINKEINPPTNIAYLSKKSVELCVKSGGTDQSALITIGGESSLAIHTDIKSGASCGA